MESVSIVPPKRVAIAFANKSSRHAPSAKSLPSDAVQHHASFHQSSDLGIMIDGILHEEEKARELARQVELARQIELERQRDLARYD